MHQRSKYSLKSILLLFIFSLALPSLATTEATENTPVGLWTTIDDKTGKAKSIVKITTDNEILTGHIIELLNDNRANPVCKKCKGENTNKPILGLKIIWGVQKKGSAWKGKILDPNNGKTYKVKLTTTKEGQHLKVRGYIGNPLFGRTQTWIRKKPL